MPEQDVHLGAGGGKRREEDHPPATADAGARRKPVAFSVLDLAPITVGGSASQTFANTLDLARHAEQWGYTRYWLAEHHNIPGIASAATSVLIGHVAAGTSRIRVGSGGVMLPNHAPLVIAEQFGTLESLFPGRIDLGIGRAPGGDHATARALRRHLAGSTAGKGVDTFPDDLVELTGYLGDETVATSGSATPVLNPPVRAIPGRGTNVPVYLLGSSDFSARLAAELGIPFAFASHFAPDYLHMALSIYRDEFKPSARWPSPYVMVGVNVFAADTDAGAERLFTSLQRQFLNLLRGEARELAAPVESLDGLWNPAEKAQVQRMTRVSAVGSPTAVKSALDRLVEETAPDELVCTAQIFDHRARLRSFEILSGVMGEINALLRRA